MRTKLRVLLLLLFALSSSGIVAQTIYGPAMTCPGETATYYFDNGSTFDSNCKAVDYYVTFNGQTILSQHVESPTNPTAFTVTFPNVPGTATVGATGFKCCVFNHSVLLQVQP